MNQDLWICPTCGLEVHAEGVDAHCAGSRVVGNDHERVAMERWHDDGHTISVVIHPFGVELKLNCPLRCATASLCGECGHKVEGDVCGTCGLKHRRECWFRTWADNKPLHEMVDDRVGSAWSITSSPAGPKATVLEGPAVGLGIITHWDGDRVRWRMRSKSGPHPHRIAADAIEAGALIELTDVDEQDLVRREPDDAEPYSG